MTALADRVLPLIRTRRDLHRYNAANAHGRQMRDAVAMLEGATEDPADVLDVTQRAITSAVKIVLRADDSAGIIGDAIRGLLDLHPKLAAQAGPDPAKLVGWMIAFQFDGEQDFFELDPVAYAEALGPAGLDLYRAELDAIDARVGPELTDEQEHTVWERRLDDADDWHRTIEDRHTRFVLAWNRRRLAVADRDPDAVIRTHLRGRRVAAWVRETAEALEEIDEHDLAIDYARQASETPPGHQAKRAAEYWCRLLAEHRPDDLTDARLATFRTWPDSGTAAALRSALGDRWPQYQHEVMDRLSESPRSAVWFTLDTLGDAEMAWMLAHSLGLTDNDIWLRLIKAYEKTNPTAVLDPLADIVTTELEHTGAKHYKSAARHLKHMRRLARGTDRKLDVERLVAELRAEHKRRPRLQQEFDRAGLP